MLAWALEGAHLEKGRCSVGERKSTAGRTGSVYSVLCSSQRVGLALLDFATWPYGDRQRKGRKGAGCMGRALRKAGSPFPLSSAKSKSQAHPSCRACWESSPPAARLVGLRGAGHMAPLNQTGGLPASKKGQEDGGAGRHPCPPGTRKSLCLEWGSGLCLDALCILTPLQGSPGDGLREAHAGGQGELWFGLRSA